MELLIKGSTAREHVLAWKFAESRKCGNLYCNSPFSGVDTLCTAVDESAEQRLMENGDILLVPEEVCVETLQKSRGEAVTVVVDCFTDGYEIIPMPAVRTYQDREGASVAAWTAVPDYTPALAHKAFHQVFVPYIRVRQGIYGGYAGVARFVMEICGGELRLVSVHRGFGEMDALALLPLLRGNLADILVACKEKSLQRKSVAFYPLHTAVLSIGAQTPGTVIDGIPMLGKTTGVFFGTARFSEGHMQTAGCRPLVLCIRDKSADRALELVREESGKIAFQDKISYANCMD